MANLNSETLSEMVKLKFSSRKAGGPDIDLVKLAGDATYAAEIFSAVGTYAIGTQILCYALLGVGSYLLSFGLSYDQKAPMVLGTCTRNVGPALATLMGVADAPQGAITMCILAIFLGMSAVAGEEALVYASGSHACIGKRAILRPAPRKIRTRPMTTGASWLTKGSILAISAMFRVPVDMKRNASPIR